MVTIYISHENGTLGKQGNSIAYRKGRSGDTEIIPISVIDDIVVIGRGGISTPAMHFLMDENIPVHFIDGGGRYKGSLTSGRGKGHVTKRFQFAAVDSHSFCLSFVRSVIAAKLANQRATLLRTLYRFRRKDKHISETCDTIESLIDKIGNIDDIEQLRGIEGIAAASYFSAIGRCFISPWIFTHRNRRPPKDPVNVLLSFGYTLLLSNVVSAVVTAGFDPCVGFLHPEYRGRPSLALDLMEEFRSVIIDRLVISVLNQQIILPSNFRQEGEAVLIDAEGRKKFLRAFSERLKEEATNKQNGIRSSYLNHIRMQSQNFSNGLKRGGNYLPFLA